MNKLRQYSVMTSDVVDSVFSMKFQFAMLLNGR
jgi:hypothetical protein